jgi:hypothetical protein
MKFCVYQTHLRQKLCPIQHCYKEVETVSTSMAALLLAVALWEGWLGSLEAGLTQWMCRSEKMRFMQPLYVTSAWNAIASFLKRCLDDLTTVTMMPYSLEEVYRYVTGTFVALQSNSGRAIREREEIWTRHSREGVHAALCYMPEGREFRTGWGEWIISVHLVLPASLGPGVHSASDINEYQKQKNNVSGE